MSVITAILDHKTWRAGGVLWTVCYVEEVDRDGAAGDVDWVTQEIRIRANMSPIMTARTICHELVHTIGFQEGAADASEMFMLLLVENGV